MLDDLAPAARRDSHRAPAATTRRSTPGSRSRRAAACRCPHERYFQPSSRTMKTTLPSSSSDAILTATRAIAPEETPANSPLLVEQLAGQRDRIAVRHEDLAVQQGEVDDRRNESVLERAQSLDRLALHRLGGDDLDARRRAPPSVGGRCPSACHRSRGRRRTRSPRRAPRGSRAPCRCSGRSGSPRCRTGRACSSADPRAAMSSAISTAPLDPFEPSE